MTAMALGTAVLQQALISEWYHKVALAIGCFCGLVARLIGAGNIMAKKHQKEKMSGLSVKNAARETIARVLVWQRVRLR